MKKNRHRSLKLSALDKKLSWRSQTGAAKSTDWSDSLLPGGLDKNMTVDNDINHAPLWLIAIAVVVLFTMLFLQLFQLQVVEGERFRGIADGNRVRENVDFAPRGKILDSNGVVLAENTASFQLSATPMLLPREESERERIYGRISDILDLTPEEISQELTVEGLDHPQPVLIEENIDRELALQLEYLMPRLTGFSLDAIPIRSYKSDAALSHILGYVGRVSQDDLERNPELYPLDFIGKEGIETQYDHILRGENGVKETEVDSLGRPLRTLREMPGEPGENLRLTIDYELQKELKQAIERQIEEAGVEKGAGVVLDPRNGDVLASVSLPAYDNNVFAEGISNEAYEALLNDPLDPMLNRVAEGGYPTGSTIKPITLMAALETGTIDENTTIHDSGAISVGDFTFRGWNPDGLGNMDARSAIAMSSNIYFYTVGGGHNGIDGMGVDALAHYYSMFGFGTRSGIDLPNEATGRVPDPGWKLQSTGEAWYIGDTYNLSIGQGDFLASPLQMAFAYSALANQGTFYRPHLRGDTEPEITDQLDLRDHHFRVVREGMLDVISFDGTTSPLLFEDIGVEVAGKSGTAETDPGRREPHAWFSAFAPYDNPEVVAAVIIEEGEASEQFAAPVIAEVFEGYFSRR